MSAIQPLNFEGHEVRADVSRGEPWFAARDVCEALGIAWHGKTLSPIKPEWQGLRKFLTPKGEQSLTVISEPAVYKLAFRSRKPEAERLADWLASEVIPAIRKTGRYESRQTNLFEEHIPVELEAPIGTLRFSLPKAELLKLVQPTLAAPLPAPVKPRRYPHPHNPKLALFEEHDFEGATEGMHGWFTTNQIAGAVGCPRNTVQSRIYRGDLPKGWGTRKKGGRWLIFVP